VSSSPAKERARLRTETPDPFEAFEKKQQEEGLKATDFAFEEEAMEVAAKSGAASTATSSATAAPPTLPPTSFARVVSPPLPPPAAAHNLFPELAFNSPAALPTPLPPLEKAQEAIEVEGEMAALREDLAADGRSPSPTPVFAQSPSPIVPPPAEKEDEVMYFDDLGKAATTSGEKPLSAGKTTEPEEFFSDWSRSPSPPPRRRSGSAASDSLFLPADSDEDDDEEAAEAAAQLAREDEGYANMVAEMRQERLEKVRTENEREVERLKKQKQTEMRNADGITRGMAGDIKVSLLCCLYLSCLLLRDEQRQTE
jgi:hypothetical protein